MLDRIEIAEMPLNMPFSKTENSTVPSLKNLDFIILLVT